MLQRGNVEGKKAEQRERNRNREGGMNVKRGVGSVGTGSMGSLLFHKPTCITQLEDNAAGSCASIRTPLSFCCMYEHLHNILSKGYNKCRNCTFLLSFAVAVILYCSCVFLYLKKDYR